MRKTSMNAFFRHIRRTILHPFSRFIALLAIVALGCGCLAGLLATAPDIRSSIDTYYDERSFMDLNLLSTLGFSDADITALSELDCIENVRGGFERDVMLSNGGNLSATRVISLGDGSINESRLESGRMPQASGECVVVLEESWASSMQIGDTLAIAEKNDYFVPDEFTVVGFISTPAFISVEKDTTTIGEGKLALMIYINESDFDSEIYTTAYAAVRGAKELNAFSDEYTDLIDRAADDVKALAKTRKPARLEEVRSDAQNELDDAKQEYDDAKAKADEQLSDAKQKLSDAKAELESGEAQLADAKNQVADGESQLAQSREKYTAEIAAAEKKLSDGRAAIVSAQAAIDENENKLNAAQAEVNSGRAELQQKEQELSAASEQISAAQAQLDAASAQLTETKAQLDSAKAQLDEKSAQLDAAQSQIESAQSYINALIAAGRQDEAAAAQAQLDALTQEFNSAKQAYDAALSEYNSGLAQYEAGAAEYSAGVNTLNTKKEEYQRGAEAIEAAKAELDSAQAEIDAGSAELKKGKNELETQREALLAGAAALAKQKQSGYEQLEAAAKELANARAKISKSEKQLADGWLEYNDGLAEYNDAKADADSSLKDAAKKISDAQKEIDDLEEPEWYVRTRTSNIGYSSVDSNAENMEGIAKVFPVFFFLVAALVALTSMTRMVEEDRTLIGTFKALGYSSGAITAKYMSYAALATLIGGVLGSLVGFKLLPSVIWHAFSLMYTVTYFETPIIASYIAVVTAIAMAVVLLTTFAAIRSALREAPASLMRPKAPKPNKRIFLEHITPLWKRLKFTHKVTARNIFRYKKRLFMTLFGIMGCTALLLTGFGLKDSIDGIVLKQYDEIVDYNYTIILDDEGIISAQLSALLADKSKFAGSCAVAQKSADTITKEKNIFTYLMVFDNDTDVNRLINLQHRTSGEAISMQPGSVIITEKLSILTGLKAGDTLTVESDGRQYDLPIGDVTENYIYHYVYIDAQTYSSIFGEAASHNAVLAQSAEGAGDLSSTLLSTEGVSAISSTDSLKSSFSESMDKLNAVVYVLVLMASGLAFIVLYNLTNINIEERKRELATIKMLGFYDGEVGAYVFRETVLLSVMGTVLGLIFGIWLFEFVVKTSEIDITMFSRDILPMSYVYSAALTIAFTGLVCLFMYFRLKKISMVDSLGSGE